MKHPILGIISIILTCLVTVWVTVVTGNFSGWVATIELIGCLFGLITIIRILWKMNRRK